MKIIFLGTSTGKTSANRFHSSLLFSFNDYNLLVDAGEGVSLALLKNNTDYDSVNGILLTHLHPDHFAGLPGLIIQMKLNERKKPLQIFIHESLKSVVQNLLLNSYILPDRINFEIRYVTFKENEEIKITEKFSFIGRKNSHLSKLENYKSIYPVLSLFSGSFLFRVENKQIVYTSDIGSEKDLLLFQDITPDILITEANHISINSIIDEYQNSSFRIYLTHYSDEDSHNISEILASLPKPFQDKIKLAQDLQIVEI